jgi:hypothetical protein
MSKTTWHKGAPPSIGWWPASVARNGSCICWWNGEWWSVAANPSTPEFAVKRIAATKAIDQDAIEWSKRWWL